MSSSECLVSDIQKDFFGKKPDFFNCLGLPGNYHHRGTMPIFLMLKNVAVGHGQRRVQMSDAPYRPNDWCYLQGRD
jgi:hypothetical protein